MTPDEMASALTSWRLHLRGENRSPETVKSYQQGVHRFMEWCKKVNEDPVLDKAHVNRFVVAQLDAGRASSTVACRQLAIRQFSAWLAAEDYIDVDELLGLRMPKVAEKALQPLTEGELRAFFAACVGKSFVDRRDEALVRLMAETMCRAEDTLSMTISNTRITDEGGEALVIGKGSRPRIVSWGAKTGVALDRYLKLRRKHKLAHTDNFWLGGRERTFGYSGLYGVLCARAAAAGIKDFQGPHQFRRTGSTRWLEKGGSETGLMAANGWSSLTMVRRYTGFTKQRRAAEESRKLDLGNL
jgi:integrase/recombinase XerD